jgi:large subunit ribosomal protein L19
VDRIREIERNYLKKELPEFQIGDVVDVQSRIKEGEKERIQTFSGTVIARKGSGVREAFTVRRIVSGEGVERIFPIHAPSIVNVIVRRPGRARRAKLYYLRERVGKSTKTKERREDDVVLSEGAPPAATGSKKREEPVPT